MERPETVENTADTRRKLAAMFRDTSSGSAHISIQIGRKPCPLCGSFRMEGNMQIDSPGQVATLVPTKRPVAAPAAGQGPGQGSASTEPRASVQTENAVRETASAPDTKRDVGLPGGRFDVLV